MKKTTYITNININTLNEIIEEQLTNNRLYHIEPVMNNFFGDIDPRVKISRIKPMTTTLNKNLETIKESEKRTIPPKKRIIKIID